MTGFAPKPSFRSKLRSSWHTNFERKIQKTNDEDDDEEEDAPTRLNMRYATEKKVHSPYRHVRTRLYFTSESHLHSLLNILKYAHLEENLRRRACGERKQQVVSPSPQAASTQKTATGAGSGGASKMNVFGDLFSPSKPPRPPNTSADVSYDSKSDLDSDFTFAKKNPLVVEGLDEILGERSKELDYLTHIVFLSLIHI